MNASGEPSGLNCRHRLDSPGHDAVAYTAHYSPEEILYAEEVGAGGASSVPRVMLVASLKRRLKGEPEGQSLWQSDCWICKHTSWIRKHNFLNWTLLLRQSASRIWRNYGTSQFASSQSSNLCLCQTPPGRHLVNQIMADRELGAMVLSVEGEKRLGRNRPEHGTAIITRLAGRRR
jgi:hypothetical protein